MSFVSGRVNDLQIWRHRLDMAVMLFTKTWNHNSTAITKSIQSLYLLYTEIQSDKLGSKTGQKALVNVHY